MARFHFTTRSVEARKPTNKREDHYDLSFRVRGVSFGLRIAETGSKEYFVRYRDSHGKQRRMSLGDAAVKPLAKARERAREIATALDIGRNPAEELRQYRLGESVEELCGLYLDQHARFKKDGGAADRWRLNKDVIPHIGRMKVRDVRRRDIIALIERVAVDRGARVSASRLRALLSKLFNFALERELTETSPCAGLPKKPREIAKDRVLSETEIQALWGWLEAQPPVYAALLRLILLTAQRPMEVAGMTWAEVQADKWEIPGERTKNGRSQLVPLSALALKSIESMIEIRTGPYVFPGERGAHVMSGTIQHLSERMNRALDGKHFTPHDLRRTAATYMRKLGVAREVVSRLLNHTVSGVTAVYDRHDLAAEMRAAVEIWSNEVARIAGAPIVKVRALAFGS